MGSWADDVLSGKSRWAVTQGDCLEVLAALPADSANLIFGSPPYVAARLYLENGENLGIARGPEEWAAWMREVYAACLRVCPGLTAMVVEGQTRNYSYDAAPALLLADLVRTGVTVRKPPIYRRAGIPGSGGPDWLRNDWEWIIAATRGGRLPWSDNTACGHEPVYGPGGRVSHRLPNGERVDGAKTRRDKRMKDGSRRGFELQGYRPPQRANPGNVIPCKVGGGLMGSPLAHQSEAPFSEELARFFIKSFCPPDGVILDPFMGSGTTLSVAVQEGRRALGCDLRKSQVELTERRMQGVTPALPFFEQGPAGQGVS